MRRLSLSLALVAGLIGAATLSSAAMYCLDFGGAESAVQDGFIRVTPAMVGGQDAAGWVDGSHLLVRDQPFTEYEGAEGSKVPPPCWTCPLSQDSVISDQPAELVIRVPDGTYHVWVLCGTSYPYRSQYFDFDIESGSATKPVRFEDSYQFRQAYLDVKAVGGEARLTFRPRSLFAVAGLVLYQDADRQRLLGTILNPVRELIDFLPPAEAAKWKQVQPTDATPWPAIPEADRQRGYVIHQRHWAEVVYPDTVPLAAEMNPQLRAFACPGEYEPLNFIVYPFRELAGATVAVSDLRGPQGSIPASAWEIRRVRYMRVRPNYTTIGQFKLAPDPLMPMDPLQPLPGRTNTRYWLTVHVPEPAAPGTYTGTVTFSPRGAAAASLPVRLRVLPLRLQEDPEKLYGIYYYDPLDEWASAKDEVSKAYFLQKSEWEMADLIAHGTRNVTTSLWAAPAKDDEPGTFSFNFDLFQKKVDLWQRFGLRGPFVVAVNASGIYRKYTGQDLGSHIANATLPPPEYAQELTAMCQAIETERVRRGWPEFLYYPIDEPSTGAGAIAFMTETLKAVRAAGVRTYVTADPTLDGFAPLRPYIDVWCTQPFLPARDELLKDKAARPVDYWCYPNHINGENDHTPVNGARMTYGFGFWRSGFTALIPWIYRADVGDPWNYLSGRMSDFFNRTEDSGRPIPVAMWEAYREGYDDYRYVFTCKQLIAQSRQAGGKSAQLAEEAQKTLDYVWGRIRVQPKYKDQDLWAPREADVYRWMIAEQAVRLEELVN
ncbi:MAG: hypothetical protein HPY69_00440 [Armatimonadetes bacterium]|nr:hypothetical protein [Armatimonadota bacterium]